MSYYIVNGAFYAVSTGSNELYHYGVKGMKWGKRMSQMRTASADRNIGRLSTSKAASKLKYEMRNKQAEAKYYGGRTKIHNNFITRALDKHDAKKLHKTKSRNRADYDYEVLSNDWQTAKQKGRKDKTYKKSAEYKSIRSVHRKATLGMMFLGSENYLQMRADMIGGDSKRKATGKAIVKSILG